ncbi:MAG: 1-acyl-sn-glycerol-3-phosphate acyltransferase [Saprospiraceae bacterium]|jgi:1-acyl-sn-glycerol-3-phosphate acyltransferase
MIRWLGKKVHGAMGWKLDGHFPNELPKKILVVVPHTSFLDFFVGIPVKFWLDIKAQWYLKKSLFRWPLGVLLRSIGGNPIDRAVHSNTVGQIVHNFETQEKHTILITPEGTRNKVTELKSGFYQIAVQANVPIVPLIFNYPEKIIHILDTIYTTGEEGEFKKIEDSLKGYIGKYSSKSF